MFTKFQTKYKKGKNVTKEREPSMLHTWDLTCFVHSCISQYKTKMYSNYSLIYKDDI